MLKKLSHTRKGFLVWSAAFQHPLALHSLLLICQPYLEHTLECNPEDNMARTSYCFIKQTVLSCFLTQAIRSLKKRDMSDTSDLWQIKLILEFFSSRSHQERQQNQPKRGLFMNSEFLPVVKCTIDATLDQWLQGMVAPCPCACRVHVTRPFYSDRFHWQTR